MRFSLLLVFAASLAYGQTPTEKKLCYEQSQKYVNDLNEHENPKAVFVTRWTWRLAHFDPKVQVCYVRYDRATNTSTNPIITILVDDAFEGKNYAQYIGGINMRDPTTCVVNSKDCHSFDEFNDLLSKFIPVRSKTKSGEQK